MKDDFLFKDIQIEREETSKGLKLVTLFGYFIGYTFILITILTLICSVIVGVEIGLNGGDTSDSEYILEQVLQYVYKYQIIIDAIFLSVVLVVWRKVLGFNKLKEINICKMFISIVICSVIFFVVNLGLGFIIELVVGSSSGANEEALAQMKEIAPWSLIFAAVIFAPIVEEIVFRGCLYEILEKDKHPLFPILISGAIFASIHVFAGLMGGNLLELVYFIQYFALGSLLGYFYYRTKNLPFCIAIHMLNNLISVLLMFLL